MSDLAKRFMDLFVGLARAHGEYRPTGKVSAKGKAEGKAKTLKEPVTEKLWKDHLSGRLGLGIVPVDDEGLTKFGAIDVDIYDLDPVELEGRIRSAGLPLLLCRTKSGGAHLLLFLKERGSAREVRSRLRKYAETLGYPKAEIFPKQDKIEDDDCGSWINMPYFGDSRKAIREGRELTAEEFLALADRMTMIEADDFEGAPPCLKAAIARGVSEGIRDNTAFAVCVYCKARHGEGWQDEARFLIRKHIPSLDKEQALKTVRSVGKKASYRYRCKDEPLASLCDKERCAEAEYGVRERRADLGIRLANLRKIKTDPPTWVVEIDGKDLELKDTDDLTLQPRFRRRCFEEFNVWPRAIRSRDWDEIIAELGRNCTDLSAPDDAGRTGEVMGQVSNYFGDRMRAKHKDELISGKPYEEDGFLLFNSTFLLDWLKKKRVTIGGKELWNVLRKFGAEIVPKQKIKGKAMRLWKMPSDGFAAQTEPFDVPEIPKERKAEF